MDSEDQKQYHALVRGAATYILLRKKELPTEASELASLYQLDLATVSQDIDTIVQTERHKAGGVFEIK